MVQKELGSASRVKKRSNGFEYPGSRPIEATKREVGRSSRSAAPLLQVPPSRASGWEHVRASAHFPPQQSREHRSPFLPGSSLSTRLARSRALILGLPLPQGTRLPRHQLPALAAVTLTNHDSLLALVLVGLALPFPSFGCPRCVL